MKVEQGASLSPFIKFKNFTTMELSWAIAMGVIKGSDDKYLRSRREGKHTAGTKPNARSRDILAQTSSPALRRNSPIDYFLINHSVDNYAGLGCY